MQRDRYDLRLTTASPKAAAAYREGVDLLLSAYAGARERFERALAHDEGFALAHAGLARHEHIYGRMNEAREAIGRAQALGGGVTAREKAHVGILSLLIAGEAPKALTALLEHLEEYPRDALALSVALGAFGLYGFSGRADHDAARLELCRRLAPHYGEDWWFLTHLGWSHTEARKLAVGRRITERALELKRDNAHGAHALAHFFTEADEAEEGRDFIASWLADYEASGTLYSHIHWHRALWDLAEGAVEEALKAYAGTLRPTHTTAPPLIAFSDSASLLWRLKLSGEDQTEAWPEVHRYGTERFPGRAPHFVEWHLAMAAAGANDFEALDRRLAEMPELPPGPVVQRACEAFKAFAGGNFAQVVALLEPLVSEFVRMGGSGAQRMVLQETLDAARKRRKSA